MMDVRAGRLATRPALATLTSCCSMASSRACSPKVGVTGFSVGVSIRGVGLGWLLMQFQVCLDETHFLLLHGLLNQSLQPAVMDVSGFRVRVEGDCRTDAAAA